jgi:hypothetical protein
MEPTIEQLRKSGYKVRVIHDILNNDDPYYHLADRYTRIEVLDPQGKEWIGESRCSIKDNYNRKLGNKIALHRALKNMKSNYIGDVIHKASHPIIP